MTKTSGSPGNEDLNVYRLEEIDDTRFGALDLDVDFDVFELLGPSSLKLNWSAPRLSSTWSVPKGKVLGRVSHDFPSIGFSHPTFSQRAVEVLADDLRSNGELLPVDTKSGRFYIFNPTTIVAAIDTSKSKMIYTATGAEWASQVETFHFDAKRLGKATIFRLRECPKTVCIRQSFADKAVAGGLRGMAFRKLWPYGKQPRLGAETLIELK